ncbi:MAG: molybdopterin dehydrogenase, partial [Ignavibacteriales bacterium]|nr:molybdopterin dehydrogenase [Ignavibacteriales bacterium]
METDIRFILNENEIHTTINPSVVLLDYIRKSKKLTGTKEVCKEGDCGACTILLGEITEKGIKYKTINSCLFPIQKVNGNHVVTIEGLNANELNLIQGEFLNQGASQCGFCTPGFIVSLTGYLLNSEKPIYEEAINSIAGNICRCTGYNSIKKSVGNVLSAFNPDKHFIENRLDYLVKNNILPKYFIKIEENLKLLNSKSQIINSKITKESVFIGGGTDLFVQKPETLLKSEINFIQNIPKNKIEINKEILKIHSSTTIEEFKNFIQKENLAFNLSKLFKLFAS